MTEWALHVMRLTYLKLLLIASISFALLVVALELIDWHLDPPDTFCKSL
jgi:hypothetical protein